MKLYKKIKSKVPTRFDCPVCYHPKTVECKMDRKKMKGQATCRMCDASFGMDINHLSDPVDVFYEWIDNKIK